MGVKKEKKTARRVTYPSIFAVWRRWRLLIIDILCFAIVFFTVYEINETLPGFEKQELSQTLFCAMALWAFPFAARILLGAYNFVSRYANYRAYLRIIISDALGGIVAVSVLAAAGINPPLWQSVSAVTLYCLASLASRFLYQSVYRTANARSQDGDIPSHKISVAIVGAGRVGALLADELLCNPKSHYIPVCFIDSSNSKIGSVINGIPVYAEGRDTLMRLKGMPVQEIFIALSDISGEKARRLYDFYSETGCKVKLYDFPLIENNAGGELSKRVIRDFKIEDLLFRKSVDIESISMRDFYRGKTVLVTGGGGSIGSEICRQSAMLSPKKLIILDIYENNAYEIEQELKRKYGNSLDIDVEIASVRDRARIDNIFAKYRPDVVFHAAAHKHVPLMEHNGSEAVKNNVLGTYNTADAAEKYGVKKFILISTDKAVNPTNVMGASKRMCEMIVQCRTDSKTSFAAVRFGNVLGSNGSVIPLFRSQIESGGPVTITDRRIIRYFMTIPEASQLVMEAGVNASRGELFVLDMGAPVKILDLAENMIRISGFTPYVDIDIKEIGLRPGEKLYEELLIKTENLGKTDNKLIFIEKDAPLAREDVDEKIAVLVNAAKACDGGAPEDVIKAAFKAVIPTYREPFEVNSGAEKSDEMKMVKN